MEAAQKKAAQSARVAFFSKELARHNATSREADPAEVAAPAKGATGDVFTRGVRVFFRHAEHGWLVGTVHRSHLSGRGTDRMYSVLPGEPPRDEDGEELPLTPAQAKELLRLRREDLVVAYDSAVAPVQDLMSVTQLHEGAILHQLRGTFERGDTYLALGSRVCLSVNPFRRIAGLYAEETFQRFLDARGIMVDHLPPHIWGYAHRMYWRCLQQSPSLAAQALIFTGVAGSGKTEASKLALKFLISAAAQQANAGAARRASEALASLIMRLSSVVDLFGCAAVHGFTNSSRMTKWIEVFVTPSGVLVGGRFQVFMLERSRIVAPPEGERSFHCLYNLLAGVGDADRKRLGLENPEKYAWLYRNLVVSDTDEELDAAAYRTTRAALTDAGLAAFELDAIDSILAGIIHLRSIPLARAETLRNRGSVVEWTEGMEESVRVAASLWGVEPHVLFAEVASVTTASRAGVQTRRLRPQQADDARRNVCKAVYCALVEWLVKRLNQAVQPDATERASSIGLLDLFGTENDKKRGNMLEQLLMNTANEELQQLYNHDVFNDEVDECQEEGLDMQGLIPPDTSSTIRLVAGQPKGIYELLDESSKQGGALGADHSFLGQLGMHHEGNPALTLDPNGVFSVRHHKGAVRYGPTYDWSLVNYDVFRPALLRMFSESTNEIVKATFDVDDARPGSLVAGTVCKQYKASMDAIHALLAERHLTWCRCYRPDNSFVGFQGALVLSQCLPDGVEETIRVMRNCYPVRLPHDYFVGRYKNVLRGSSYDAGDGSVTIADILKFADIADVQDSQTGVSKVFLKDLAHKKLEGLRRAVMNPSKMVTGFIAAKLIQKATRMRRGEDAEGDQLKSPTKKGGLSLANQAQSMRVLATNLPVFLAFARGALAVRVVADLLSPPADVSPEERAEAEAAAAAAQAEAEALDETTSYLDRGILAISAPLRKLAEWKRTAQRQSSAAAALEPPPAPVLLEEDSPLRTADEVSGKLPDPESCCMQSVDLDHSEAHFKDPDIEHHDYNAIILKEAETLNKMSADDLFDCLGQGRREVHASLRLSAAAVEAIKRLVAQGQLHERHSERVRRNRAHEEQAIMQREGRPVGRRKGAGADGGFPDTLGPLALCPCGGNLVTKVVNGRYTVPLASIPSLKALVEAGIPSEGRVSPESPVTLPPALRRKASIPRLAKSFVWAYPLPGVRGLRGLKLDQRSSAAVFVAFGGFVYLDERGLPLSVNALSPGEGLSFQGPHRWERTPQVRQLEESGRMQPITIDALSETGARYFCWLLPGEDIGQDPVPEHGGFVYLFREPNDEACMDDVYFTIQGSDQQEGVKEGGKTEPKQMNTFKKREEEKNGSLIELPRIEGVKELEGVVVHRRVAKAIDEIIASDMAVQKCRLGLEPLNPSLRVALHKNKAGVPFHDPGALSPIRHHMRRPEEFVDVEGGWLGWNKDGLSRPQMNLDYSGDRFPFPNGITTQLSPLRSKPFFIHAMPPNHRTAFGKSVDGKDMPQTQEGKDVKSYWIEMYKRGMCGGATQDLGLYESRETGPAPAVDTHGPDTLNHGYGVHMGPAMRGASGGLVSEAEEKATRYLETIKHELDRQKYS